MFDPSEKLALEGGPRAKRTPFPPRRRHGEPDKRLLEEVVEADVLFYWLGTKVREFERRFATLYGRKHCVACSSGTAAVHTALSVLELPPGSEVITTSITDMGGLTGLLYQGLVPVFADVAPDTLNLDPDCVRRLITPRTRALIATHHAGLAAEMDELLAIGRQAGIPVIEDCAQAYGTEYKGRLAGTMTPLSAFSLNHFKHIECGSGGMILTDDDRLRYRAALFIDKCYQREEGIRNPFFLAPNYQMTELQGAVALAQLERLPWIVNRRNELGTRLDRALEQIPGVSPQKMPQDCKHTYFLYLFRLDLDRLNATAEEFSRALEAEGVPNRARLITGGMPVYWYRVFQDRSAFPGSTYPFGERTYPKGLCPVAEEAFERWITMDLFEHWTENDVDEIAHGIAKVSWNFARRAAAVSA